MAVLFRAQSLLCIVQSCPFAYDVRNVSWVWPEQLHSCTWLYTWHKSLDAHFLPDQWVRRRELWLQLCKIRLVFRQQRNEGKKERESESSSIRSIKCSLCLLPFADFFHADIIPARISHVIQAIMWIRILKISLVSGEIRANVLDWE